MAKIGFLTRWNATCGVSVHAELLASELMRKGHEVKVFAPSVFTADRYCPTHHVIGKDEDFVCRCYDEKHHEDVEGGGVDARRILEEDMDFLIVESYSTLPQREVERLSRKLRERGVKVVAVIHEGRSDELKYKDLRAFDRIVCFDSRYLQFLSDYEDIVEIIPYPCHPVRASKRKFAEDKLRFFSYGVQPVWQYSDYVSALRALNCEFEYVVVRSDSLLPFRDKFLVQKRRRLSREEVYAFLHNSDIHLLPKGEPSRKDAVVVSSTLFLCLGSLVPTVVPNTKHFESLPTINGVKPAVIYENLEDLRMKIERLIEDKSFRESVKRAALRYVEENSVEKVANKFIRLLESI